MKRILATLALALGLSVGVLAPAEAAESQCPADVSAEEQVRCLRAENADQAARIALLRTAAQSYAATIFELSDQAEAMGLEATALRDQVHALEYQLATKDAQLAEQRAATAAAQELAEQRLARILVLRAKVKELRDRV